MPKQLSPSTHPLDERVATFIDQHWRVLLALILLTSALFIGLTFDPKVSIGGDDSWYVLAAQDFWNGVAFPSWHGSFYSILLSPLIALLGISLVPLKLLSVLFTLVAVWLLAVSFRKHISPLTWLIGTALFALTPHLVTLASTTYSEPLFLFIQSAIFYTLFAYEAQTGATTKQKGLWLLLLAFLTFALAITRNVGYAAFLALLIYFLALRRDWHASALYGAGFILLQVLFSVYRRLVWGVTDASFAGQLNRALQVDFYNASAGQEDLWGMLVRFAQNCKQYLSGHNMQFVGFPSATGSWVITLLVVVLLLFFLIRTWRRNRVLALLGIYLAAMYGITFITQQVAWNQMRLVLVYFPLFLFFFLDGLHELLKAKNFQRLSVLLLILLGIALLSHIVQNSRNVDIARLRSNLRGDRFAGYTPDWDSYLRMSEWVGKNIPDSVVVACRKPNNSRIYGNRPFFGIFKLPSLDADTVQQFLDSNRVEYVMCGRLRRFTEKRTEDYINTLHVMLSVVLIKQPDYIDLVHRIGANEPTVLFKLNRTPGSGTIDEQRHRIESGLSLFANNAEAYYRLGRLSLAERRPDEAHDYFMEAKRLLDAEEIPLTYPLREGFAMVYFAKGNFAAAIAEYEELTREYPNVADAWFNLGTCYAKIGDKRAKECFARFQALKGAEE